ncbi:MAG: hypothetical protein WC205_13600 [Opitutaceae bacterium]|jgi:hypothetical protein
MSTLWLSRHAGTVISIEADLFWHEKLSSILRSKNITNVDLRHEWQADSMSTFPGIRNNELDLLVVDGGPRTQCLVNGFDKVKSGGYIYLDNWDFLNFWDDAEAFLISRCAEISSQQSFVDYVPGNFAVNQGLLIRKH